MKLTIPLNVDLELTPDQIIAYTKLWIYPILKSYQMEGSDYYNSTAVVKNDKIYWAYQSNFHCEMQYKEIHIEDKDVFNICKSAVQLLETYYKVCNKDKYLYINEMKVG